MNSKAFLALFFNAISWAAVHGIGSFTTVAYQGALTIPLLAATSGTFGTLNTFGTLPTSGPFSTHATSGARRSSATVGTATLTPATVATITTTVSTTNKLSYPWPTTVPESFYRPATPDILPSNEVLAQVSVGELVSS